MCNEPLNPSLPHWRRKQDQSITATPLTGEALEAARRAQTLSDKALKEGQLAAFTGTEADDWAVYDAYWQQVSNELLFNKHPGVVTAHDVTEEVRKRLGSTDGNNQ